MIDAAAIAEAGERIAPHVTRTPLFRSEPMSERHGADLWIKAEHLQRTGSFKVRGSANFVHALDAAEAALGVVTASSGNHGIGVATAAASRGIDCTIFLPSTASASKVAAIGRLGAEIVTVDSTDTADAEAAARRHAERVGVSFISPYNDPAVIAGQGTIGKEILEDAAEAPDAIVVSVGGGGLISGIATWVAAQSPATRIIAASALNDRAMAASVAAGFIIDPSAQPTFSDGTAGGLEADTITFPICVEYVDDWIDVDEASIAGAVSSMIDDHHQLVEGSAGLALAAAGAYADRYPGSTVVAVSCGANVSAATLKRMLDVAAPR